MCVSFCLDKPCKVAVFIMRWSFKLRSQRPCQLHVIGGFQSRDHSFMRRHICVPRRTLASGNKMVLCLMYGCGTKSGRNKGAQFSKFPEIIINEGEEARKLSEVRRERWISAISREDLKESHMKHGRVCGKHFASGKTAKRWDKFNVDWVPSLCLGHGKKVSGKRLEERLDLSAKRDER